MRRRRASEALIFDAVAVNGEDVPPGAEPAVTPAHGRRRRGDHGTRVRVVARWIGGDLRVRETPLRRRGGARAKLARAALAMDVARVGSVIRRGHGFVTLNEGRIADGIKRKPKRAERARGDLMLTLFKSTCLYLIFGSRGRKVAGVGVVTVACRSGAQEILEDVFHVGVPRRDLDGFGLTNVLRVATSGTIRCAPKQPAVSGAFFAD